MKAALGLVLVVGLLSTACSNGAPSSEPAQSSTTTASTATTLEPSAAIATVAPGPSQEVQAVVDALSGGWTIEPLGVAGYGGAHGVVTRGGTRVISYSGLSGCCFSDSRLLVGPIGGPYDVVAGNDVLFPDVAADSTAMMGSGPAELIATPDGFLAVGSSVHQDHTTDQMAATAYTWTSSDGSAWDAHRLPLLGILTSVVETTEGHLALLAHSGFTAGAVYSTGAAPRDALLSSPDGVDWHVVRDLPAPVDGEFWARLSRVGNTLILSAAVVEVVSTDEGLTWTDASGVFTGSSVVSVAGGGALLVGPEETLWSRDGSEWAPVGLAGSTAREDLGPDLASTVRAAVSIGDVVVVADGSDLWATGPDSPWVSVPRAPAFDEINGRLPWVNAFEIGLDGSIVAVGAAESLVEANKPVSDAVFWTHPGLSACAGEVLARHRTYVVLEVVVRENGSSTVLCDTTSGEEVAISRWGRSIECDDDGATVTDFVLPSESLRRPFVQWSTARGGVEIAGGSLHVRDDYKAVVALATSSCGEWRSTPSLGVAALVLTVLIDELGFTDFGGDHSIDPTAAAVAEHDGQVYEVSIDLDYQNECVVRGEWIRECELGLLSFSPQPSAALLPELLDLAGCPAS